MIWYMFSQLPQVLKLSYIKCISTYFYIKALKLHMPSGLNFINLLQAAHRSRMRKKRQSSWQCFFALLGPMSIEAARKTLVKLTLGGFKVFRFSYFCTAIYRLSAFTLPVFASFYHFVLCFKSAQFRPFKNFVSFIDYMKRYDHF